MKRVGELMAELGFKQDGSDSTKEAFIKHLLRASEGVNVITPSEKAEIKKNSDRVHELRCEPEQLSFPLGATGTENSSTKSRRR